MSPLSIVFGAMVGFSLGLTGGGGAIFAVPMLVYGLGIEPREAVGISLASVGAISAMGLVGRWRTGLVEFRTGLIFAVAGMFGAPVGSWLSDQIPEVVLLLMFAMLMLVVAARMWKHASVSTPDISTDCEEQDQGAAGPSCRRDVAGNLRLTSHCAALLMAAGVATGVLSGLFGVGGGFVIVPTLVLCSGMAIHRAVSTSLLVITLVSMAGVASHLFAGREISIGTALPFVIGGIGGMFLGILASRRLSGPTLQRGFAAAIVAVAIFVIVRSTILQ